MHFLQIIFFIQGCGTDKPTVTQLQLDTLSNHDNIIIANSNFTASSEKVSFPIIKFELSATSDTTILGAQRTRIFIEKNHFNSKMEVM